MFANCAFDICQFWNGILPGTLASVFAAILVLSYGGETKRV